MEIVGLPNCRKKGVYSAEVLDSDSVVVFHGCPCVAFRCLQESHWSKASEWISHG